FLITEAQPAVRRIDEAGARARLHRALRLFRRDLRAFERNASDDRDLAVDRFDEAFDDRGLLVGGEERTLAGMTEHDQAFHSLATAEPGAEALDGVVVDVAVTGEGRDGGGYEAAKIRGLHVGFLQCDPALNPVVWAAGCRRDRSRPHGRDCKRLGR